MSGEAISEATFIREYHRKLVIRASRAPQVVWDPRIIMGRPRGYEPGALLPLRKRSS
jgi:hypothetical protein